MKTKRIEYLDTIKGFAILLMLMGHSIAWNFPCWQNVLPIREGMEWQDIKVGLIWNLIYSFHMALFFFVSGFLSYKENNDLQQAFFHKCKRLLIPYVVTGGLIVLFRGYFGYWFLFSLWQLSILAIVINVFLPKINKKKSITLDFFILCIIYVASRIFFSDRFMDNIFCEQDKFCLYYFPYMGGYLLRKYDFIQKKIQSCFSICLIGFIMFFINRYLSFEDEALRLIHSVLLHIGHYIMPIMGTLVIWEIFRGGIESHLQHYFSVIGKHTFEIYIFHIFFIVQIPIIGDFWLVSNFDTCLATQLLYSVVCSVLAICLSLIISIPIRHSKWLKKIVLGEK